LTDYEHKGGTLKSHTVNPCAFCLAKDTYPCYACVERYEMALMESDVSTEFLLDRDLSDASLSGNFPISH